MSIKILLVGAGEVGFNLARYLSKENYDITVIDNNSDKCNRINNTIDAHVIEGDGASQRIYENIDMKSIDYFLPLTRHDEVNLVASKIAKKLGVKKIISRLRNTEYIHKNAVLKPEEFYIDYVTYPEKAAQIEIESLVKQTSAVEVQEFKNNLITLIGIKLEVSSPLIGRAVKNVYLSNPFTPHICAVIYRNDESFVPHKNTIYKKNDVVYFVVDTDLVDDVQKMAGKPPFKVKNIMILGLGKIARLLAKSLQYDYNVKIVEKESYKAKKYSSTLEESLILVGDGLDHELLESENIHDIDCFIATTENEKTNMLASLIVKHHGVKQVIMHISTTDYIKSVRTIGVDAVVSKNISAVNEVLKIIQTNQEEVEISRFEDIDIDSLEITVKENCKYFTRNYSIDDIPESICLSAISRNNKVFIPNNSKIHIEPNDKLLIFLKPETISKAESLFL